MRSKFSLYNHGSLSLSHGGTGRGSFGQAVNVTDAESLEVYETAQFRRMSVRAQDYDFAEQADVTLDAKVAIRNVPALVVGDFAILNGTVYRVGQLDRSNDLREAYLYLEEVR